jgi:general secretion pathway protein L
MSLLIVQLPASPRLSAQSADTADVPSAEELDFAFSQDGIHLTRSGRAALADLPAATQRVAVLAPGDISWHRVTLPKASGLRLRQALAGLLEESLLDDETELHLALPPQARGGETVWVAAINRSWLRSQIARLEPGGQTLDRVVPAWRPDGSTAAHVHGSPEHPQLAWRDAQGALCRWAAHARCCRRCRPRTACTGPPRPTPPPRPPNWPERRWPPCRWARG